MLAPESLDQVDWSWADERLDKVRRLGIRPIVGLLHHGSGPRYTDLTEPEFPSKFARFASQVIRRYPWIDAVTPINEPLTTARFSGLYGHWYPHRRDDRTFVTALLNQIRATILAMRAIREVNANAILVQTDDLGRTFSTRAMKYQADFDNERRWLTWDLLLGRLKPGEKMWRYFSGLGVDWKTLDFFSRPQCHLDLIGINHYVTSDRYLDENVDSYPVSLRGNNGRQAYADDAAVRARAIVSGGVRTAMAEAHNRYQMPMALTEIHLGSTVDDRMHWFADALESAEVNRNRGMDVRAVTAWALLGSYGWDSLVTQEGGNYEPGAFDLRGGEPQPTRFADMLRIVAKGERLPRAFVDGPRWWLQQSRLRHPPNRELAA
jgi:dTDP-4-dehydrorhamnose reductase